MKSLMWEPCYGSGENCLLLKILLKIFIISSQGEFYAGKFINKKIINNLNKEFSKLCKSQDQIISNELNYFNRSHDYGFYKKEYSNYELEKEVRSCNLENYGLKASYFEVNKVLLKI